MPEANTVRRATLRWLTSQGGKLSHEIDQHRSLINPKNFRHRTASGQTCL
jgi:hypothetical protein